jgi:hypothetical protein
MLFAATKRTIAIAPKITISGPMAARARRSAD